MGQIRNRRSMREFRRYRGEKMNGAVDQAKAVEHCARLLPKLFRMDHLMKLLNEQYPGTKWHPVGVNSILTRWDLAERVKEKVPVRPYEGRFTTSTYRRLF